MENNKRDDFTKATKDLLASRVGWRCSNPMCYIFKVKNGKFNKEIIWILQRSVIEILVGTKQYVKRWKYY